MAIRMQAGGRKAGFLQARIRSTDHKKFDAST